MKNRHGKLEHRFSQKIQTKFNIFFPSFKEGKKMFYIVFV